MPLLHYGRSLNRRSFIIAVALFAFFAVSFFYLRISSANSIRSADETFRGFHPIDALIRTAEAEWHSLLEKQTHDLKSAAEQYRARRGRHPPPGFEAWHAFATSKNAVIVEDFFDQIYHDLSPFWGIEPQELRRQAMSLPIRIVVRDHKSTLLTDKQRDWMDAWYELVQTFQEHLPDLDMPLNTMDESRIVVPWEKLSDYVLKEQSSRGFVERENATTEYMTLEDHSEVPLDNPFTPKYLGPGDDNFWNMARVGCPQGSPSKTVTIEKIDFAHPPREYDNYWNISHHGYVKNFTQSKDICNRPEMRAIHGSFIEPISISTAHELFPLFGGSKLPINNEILIPPAMYWLDNERYSGGENNHGGEWEKKYDAIMWRGGATGGRNKVENWTGFQRHRFISMVNGTAVRLAEEKFQAPNFVLPSYEDYKLVSGMAGALPQLLDEHSDAGFMHLSCYPSRPGPDCPYTDPYFELKKSIPMKKQYVYKYLPDLDGNSFSGRFRGFLRSTSLPLKATIYNEWHDSRLIPWAHFVPMDTTFMDIYGILEYFLGYKDRKGHDDVAKKIALNGKSWSEMVLRKEDMQIYTYRLLLEYARICDDNRETLAYV